MSPEQLRWYMQGRADERQAVIKWLKAEAEDESLPSYKNAWVMAATTLTNIAATSEPDGLAVRVIPALAALAEDTE